jgi:predicted small lipoprotein YifL
MIRRLSLILLLSSLLACGAEPPPAPPPEEPAPTVLDEHIKAIDKAKAVEEQQMERQRKLDEQLDGSG